MTYEWQWYERATGLLHNIVEPGEPCVCEGDDLPHPPRLCAAIRGSMFTEPTEIEAVSRENARVSIDDAR
jgi:hypothetical protein